jgi:hypothetical protein
LHDVKLDLVKFVDEIRIKYGRNGEKRKDFRLTKIVSKTQEFVIILVRQFAISLDILQTWRCSVH